MSTSLYPLASLARIEKTPSREDGVPEDLELDLRAFGCKLIHEAGVFYDNLFQRFWYVTSMKQFGIGDVGLGALYLASKLEECPVRMRDLINFEYIPMSYFGSTFYDLKDALVVAEMQILKRLGFNVNVVLPYGTLVNYLRLLGLADREDVSSKSWGYLNDALQTPVYAVYAVPTIASAAIMLATRHLNIALPSSPDACWWELFDADWQDIWSVAGYIMRLYRERSTEDQARVMGLVSKKAVRSWIEDNSRHSSDT
ncbi:cyclin-like protein [Epithele typhae]|uniref:cyclin-like protein n=1 Tax=Epithele typhae TaxID=378194 RepID=UPI00200834C4|nr:cyclin-like protein [Epithele typhae]KAH9946217.1 cyclin-like protein [Epithele typhae]